MMYEVNPSDLIPFVKESNAIEHIYREPTVEELNAHFVFCGADNELSIGLMEFFIAVVAPTASLRDRIGMNVRVGSHVPPPGGVNIRKHLERLIDIYLYVDGFTAHTFFEHLHPFTDGNGRLGRALWLRRRFEVKEEVHLCEGFLRPWYYESLQFGDKYCKQTEGARLTLKSHLD